MYSIHKTTLDLEKLHTSHPQIMGIVNVTPDSFSDGGKFNTVDSALNQVERMIAQGVDIIDVGGESTRPGAEIVTVKDELSRVIPVLKAIKQRFSVPVSIDTSKAEVMSEAIAYGADLINDVRALQNEGCLSVVAQSNVPICLMHMQGLPQSMQDNPKYQDVIADIITFFKQRISVCNQHNINTERLLIDPGFGFGKTTQQNYQLLAHLAEFNQLNVPILAGVSRKSMIGNIVECEVEHRLVGSVTAALIAIQHGANIVRVHDVKETADAIKIWQAVKNEL
jgi:dihydropteroate synthase